ncbi:hypothetical protein [Clostridium sp. FP1]|uniref:hypothetical protein n=1 Tax=Clostridium sp. FP1 TaxID=2724076 RepID=UPI002961EC44|nr:hypothetical protein [Clostridium sp. FP1]
MKTGCSYLAIELGENLAEYTKNKFSSYDNFQIVDADFVYSAATIQKTYLSKICFPSWRRFTRKI